MLLVEHEEESS
jgi:DnaJ-domain-containing protein 1